MNLTSENLQSVTFVSYREEYASDFARLNYEWLEKYFEVEAHDIEMLDHPKEYIIDKGGEIYFAKYNDEIVGTVALIVENESTLELAKMGVTSKYQGLKIGRKLIDHALSEAKKGDKKQVVLESNTKLTAALNLYISYGFKVAPLSDCSPYARCNIRMIYHL